MLKMERDRLALRRKMTMITSNAVSECYLFVVSYENSGSDGQPSVVSGERLCN